jgi:hypothetical protein
MLFIKLREEERGKKMKNGFFIKEIITIGLFILFIGAAVVPSIKAIIEEAENVEYNKDFRKREIINDKLFPTDDTYICMYQPNTNFGYKEAMKVSNYCGDGSTDWECDILIRFDVRSIPTDKEIKYVSLNLDYFYHHNADPTGREISCYRITENWEEEDATWMNRPSYALLPTAYEIVPSNHGLMSWDVTADVRDFIDGTQPNYGWWIMDEVPWCKGGSPEQYYSSKESGVSPYLFVELNKKAKKTSENVIEAESDWTELQVSMSRNKHTIYDSLLFQFLEQFSLLRLFKF